MSGKKAQLFLLACALAAAMPPVQAAAPIAAKREAMTPSAFTLSHGTNTLRAILVSAPPVYNPGGQVCFVEEWQGDESLLANAEQTAAERGAVLVRVICPHDDLSRAKTLAKHGYAVASEWYAAPLPLAGRLSAGGIRPLTAADVPRVLELGEMKRQEYAAYSPVFWRVSQTPREAFAPYLQSQIEDTQNVALAHAQDGKVDGFTLMNARGTIDDYTVAAPGLWPTVGADLLRAAGDAAHQHGIKSLLVICGHGDKPKRAMLAAQGLILVTDWYVKAIKSEKK